MLRDTDIHRAKSGTRKRPILQRDLLLHVFEKRSWLYMLSAFLRDVDCQSSRAVMNYNKLFRERKRGTAVLTATREMLDWWNYFSFFRIFSSFSSLVDNNLG